MKNLLTILNDNIYLRAIVNLYTLSTIIWGLLSYFDLMPFYQVKLFKINSITPTISLFPSQKIRLNFDSHQAIARVDINSANWQLLKDNKILFEEEGLEPTIHLPPTDGGIFQLKVIATLNDKSIKSGQINFYIVQDTPKQVTYASYKVVNLTSENNTPKFLKNVQQHGAEIYTGNGQWKKVEATSASENNVTVKLKANEPISSFNNEMLIRAQGSAKDLSNYGTAQVPSDYIKPMN